MIEVVLPSALRDVLRSAGVTIGPRLQVEVSEPVTWRRVVDAIESAYPTLRGTLRDPVSGRRRPLLRLFAAGMDVSNIGVDEPLPEQVRTGREPLLVVTAVAGG